MAISERFYFVKNCSIQMTAEQGVDHKIIIMESIYKSNFNVFLYALCLCCFFYSQREHVFTIVYCQLIQG